MDPLDRVRLSAAECTLIRRDGIAHEWGRGEVLMHHGGACGKVILVDSGLVKAGVVSADGHESLLAIRGPCELLGEASFLDGGCHSATVTTLTQMRGVAVASGALRELLKRHPGLARKIQRIVLNRWRQSDRLRAAQGSYRGTAWIAWVLLELGQSIGTRSPAGFPGGVGVQISQEVLAAAGNVSTDSVGRAFGVLRDAQLIAPGYRQVVLIDPQRLENWVRAEG